MSTILRLFVQCIKLNLWDIYYIKIRERDIDK